ncbi:response regulator [Desulfobacter latus]|uniref:histidine kinase n=1 Tax=Desulfobacter latus TaxID=2292 RepID=A0A850SYJ0_9BACT|nr:response regulator [Desulfobacter latus]NWH03781.1 response regulator [Desulfobacter latus]
MTNPDNRPKDAADLRQKAETLARQRVARTPKDSAGLSPDDIQDTLHELRVHQIELEMQNEELRAAQAEIEAGRARYFDLYDLAPVGYCTLSEKGLIAEANLTAATLLGTNRSALIKQPISRFILKEDQDIYYLHRKQLFQTGEPQECELRLVKPDGTHFWAHLTVIAAQAEDGAPVCRVVLSDITERKRAEEAVARQQRSIKLSSRIANVFLISSRNEVFADVLDVLLKDLDSRFGYLGYIDEAGDLVCPSMTRDVWDQCQIAEKSVVFPRSVWGGLWGRSLMKKQTLIANENLRIPEGHVALENALATPIVHHDNLIGQFVVANKAEGYDKDDRDLLESVAAQTAPILFAIQEEARQKTAHEKLEEQMRQAQKMESVGRLAGGVAHDFNNMLSVILGNTEIAMEDLAPDDPLHNNLSEIFSAANRSADITRQLLAFARKQTIAPKVLDLNRTIKSMLKMLRRLIGEDIDLAWRPETTVWPVRMDPSQIDQILANLCINARDAIADIGMITIETGKATFDSTYCAEHPGFVAGDFVLLAVSDDGCGMEQETLANLFEPFFTTKDVDKGTGLGLATVYGIVKQNEGFINIYSEPGQGSIFRIYLPRYLAATESPEKKNSDKFNQEGDETILLVEDEPSILKMTRMMLERTGYKVLAAGTPEEAIALAREHAGEIDLLMTDVVMPEMNGRDLAKNLRLLYPNLNLLFMSGYTANVIAHHGVLDEGVQFIQKPFAKQDLVIKVREVLDEAKELNR